MAARKGQANRAKRAGAEAQEIMTLAQAEAEQLIRDLGARDPALLHVFVEWLRAAALEIQLRRKLEDAAR